MRSNTKMPAQASGNKISSKQKGKHEVNLRKNGWLHFQIGLILSLMIAYFTVELSVPFLDVPKTVKMSSEEENILEEPIILQLTPPKPAFEAPLSEPQPENAVSLGEEIKIIENSNKTLSETPNVVSSKTHDTNNLSLGEIKYEKEPEVFSIIAVETVPLFPGCENMMSNQEKIDCFSSNLNKIISRNFNSSIGAEYGLQGVQRIHLVFKIDTSGNIVDIKTRAPHPALAKEAERVIKMVPKLSPGKQNQNPVEVLFAKPIVFKID